MTVCVSCRLYSLRDGLENLISRETEGLARCQNFPTHREVNTTDRKHALDALENFDISLDLRSREISNFPTHLEVNTTDRKHALA